MKIKLIFLGLLFCSMLNCMQRGPGFQPNVPFNRPNSMQQLPQPMPIVQELDEDPCQDYYDELNDLKDKLEEFKEKVKLLKELKEKADMFAQSVKEILDEFDSNFNQFNQHFNW